MINNRQAGRRRGRGGGNNPGGGGQRQGNPGRPDNGNRIDSRARGNASQLYEKYKNMAADAQRQGDRVNIEYYLQFADHYFRVLSEQRGRFEDQQPRRTRDDFDFDGNGEFGGGEFGDEGELVRGNEQGGEQGNGQRLDRDDGGRDGRSDRQRDDRPRTDGRNDRGDGRDDRPRVEGRDERPLAEREERPRDGFRRDGNGDGRGEARVEAGRREWQEREPRRGRRPEPPVEVAGQRRAEPMVPGESLENRAEDILENDRPLDPPAPRRRGRPRRDAEPVAANEVTQDVGEANGFEADRLPPSLTVAANDEAPAGPKPRRRRVRPAEDTPTAAE